MPRKYVDYKLDTSLYKIYPCSVEGCNNKAEYRFGERSPDGHGYDMESLCEKHYQERKSKIIGGSDANNKCTS